MTQNDTDDDIHFITRGEWHCVTCGKTETPPPTLVEHYDEEHPKWRSNKWWRGGFETPQWRNILRKIRQQASYRTMTNERTYVAFASDGDQAEDVSREEALEWADEHLSMLESLEPVGADHWVQISSYRPEFNESTEASAEDEIGKVDIPGSGVSTESRLPSDDPTSD